MWMIKAIFVLLLTNWLSVIGSYAQYGNVWQTFPGLDFNTFPPVPVSGSGILANVENIYGLSSFHQLRASEAHSTVCDRNGIFLFYTNGTNVFNRESEIMPNGYNIVDTTVGYEHPIRSTHEGTLIVPMINEDSLFYVFSLGGSTSGADFSITKKLFYSIVDLRLDNGLGDVISGKKGIFMEEPYAEGMIAVPGNHCNVWLVLRSYYSGDYHAFEITESGINTNPVVSTDPSGISGNVVAFNYNVESRKFFIATNHNFTLWDFDPTTGMLSQPINVVDRNFAQGFNGHESIAFDSSGQFVFYRDYVDGVGYRADIHVYDPDSIKASREALPFLPDGFILGPDYKLYCVNTDSMTPDAYGYIPNPTDSMHNLVYIPLASSRAGLSQIFRRSHQPIVKVSAKDHLFSEQVFLENTSCFGSALTTLTINQDNPWDIEWSTGDTTSSIHVNRPGVYSVRYALSPCEWHADTFTVAFLNGVLPEVEFEYACKGTANGKAWAGTYPGDTVIYHYLWKNSQQDTLSVTDTLHHVPSGNYTVQIMTDSCDTTLSFFIPEEDYQVSFTSSDALICLGDTLQLTNTSDSHFTAYYWDLGNGDTLSGFEPVPYVYAHSGTYRVMLAGVGAICADTAYQTIIVDQPPVPEFNIDPNTVCLGRPVYFYPLTDSTTMSLQWALGDQLRGEQTLESRYQYAFDKAGVLPVTLALQSRACPDTSYTDSITVYPLPEVDLGTDSSICLHGQPLYLKNLREAPLGPYHQVWSTGDTTEVLKVVRPGIYTLSVTTEPIGCTTTELIEIRKDCYIDIPNAFTPNGDGNNDYFFPRQMLSEGLARFRMQVFNRWGQVVFETTHLDGRGWDGNLNGKIQPIGIYLYRIEADFKNGRQESYEGNVTLIR